MISRSLLLGLISCIAAWLVFRRAFSVAHPGAVPVDLAAEKLR